MIKSNRKILTYILMIGMTLLSISTTHAQSSVVVIPLGDSVSDTVLNDIAQLKSSQPFAVTQFERLFENLISTATPYISLSVTAPVTGHVTLNSTTMVGRNSVGQVGCAIRESTALDSINGINESDQFFESTVDEDVIASLSGTRTFSISANSTVSYVTVCRETGSDGGRIIVGNLTAIFTPAPQ